MSDASQIFKSIRRPLRSRSPWSVDDAPEDFTDLLVTVIVGVEIEIETQVS
ncbi:MAG: FMN-binding negative transcriptional regulator [Pseudohongiella sp.]|nr:FMN-binding negative transcriptional regulator [Pseudohongiella sp.]